MWLILFSTVVGAIMIAARLKELKEIKESLNTAMANKKFEKYDYSKWVKTLYIVMIIFGIGSSIYGLVIKEYDTCAIGIIIVLMFISELLLVPYRFVLYYNDTQFISNGKLVRYKSIKGFEEMKFFKFGFVRARSFNDELYPLSKKAYEIVKEKKENKAK